MQQTTVMQGVGSTLNRVRRPEYTGENRCVPCTVTNVVIAGVLTAATFVLSPWLAAAVAVTSAAAIYLRGYLVPGTPELTKRYLPARMHHLFDRASPEFVPEAFQAEQSLVEAGTVVPVSDDLALDPAFGREWYARMDTLTNDEAQRRALAGIVGLDAEHLRLDERPGRFVAWYDGEWLGQWESRAAFVADAGGGEVLATRIDSWDSMPVAYRSELLAGLRLFLDACPTCGGAVVFGTDVVESCCRSYDVVAATCEAGR
ncbi:hypothetical protein [Haloarchaeobius sp. HRN-SO-5]|uniref:hypothetical protein n=1 Tax=Haloarchaeobius sp. HRN-SO-5 TaxID=3446118 RepID=UPI003EB99E1F